jgi:hypothetical protein
MLSVIRSNTWCLWVDRLLVVVFVGTDRLLVVVFVGDRPFVGCVFVVVGVGRVLNN